MDVDSLSGKSLSASSRGSQNGFKTPSLKGAPSDSPTQRVQTRAACDACRDRKIRCNRQRPIRQRCSKMKIACHYSSRSSSTPSKLDMSRILATMHQRLEQAEAQLASNSQELPLVPGPSRESHFGEASESNYALNSASPNLDYCDLGIGSDNILTIQPTSENSDEANNSYTDFPFDLFAPNTSMDPLGQMLTPSFLDGANDMYSDSVLTSSLNFATPSLTPGLSAQLLHRLSDICFDIFYPMMSMVDRSRFNVEASYPVLSTELQALSHIIGALGALAVPELRCHVEQCYQQSRTLLDLCERKESSEGLTSIRTLQACTLLAVYELKQPNSRRAWMSLGRAIRLAKMMGLDQEDGESAAAPQWCPATQLDTSFHPAEGELRRRTFWVLYMTHLQVPGESHVALSAVKYLSVYQGPISLSETLRRAKTIGYCRTDLLAEHLKGDSRDDPVSLAFRLCVGAIELMLHDYALTRIQKDNLPSVLANDAIHNCTSAVTDIVQTLQMGESLTGRKLESFQQLNNFHAWPISEAIQTCCRQLDQGSENAIPYAHVLSTLCESATTKYLVDYGLISSDLLRSANSLVAISRQSLAITQT